MDDRPPDSMVSIRRPNSFKSSGAGVLLGGGMVLTCAHVVNDVLGREPFEQQPPGDVEISVEIPRRALGRMGTARVETWIPPAGKDGSRIAVGDDECWLGDLSVLRLEQRLGDAAPPAPRYSPMKSGQRVRAWHGSGALSSFADATINSCDDAVAFVDGDPTGMAIGPGYSGGPLCRLDGGDVVGLVAAHYMPDPGRPHSPQHLIRRSWVIPWQRIERDLRNAGVQLLSPAGRPHPSHENDHAYHPLMTAFERFIPYGNREQIAHAVARSCRMVVGTAMDGPEEFAGFLLEHPRAVAALSATLQGNDPAAARAVLEAGRLSATPLLLAPSEHEELLRLINEIGEKAAPLLAKAAAAALPLVGLPTVPGIRPLLDHLETLPGDSCSGEDGPRVPALLRAVEFLAPLAPAVQQSILRIWADNVAKRLNIPPGALQERRADAKEWAALKPSRPTGRPRVLVQVRTAGPDRYRVRIWRDQGGGLRQVALTGGPLLDRAGAALQIRRVLESPGLCPPDTGPPLVTVLVDRAGLNLPIDSWQAADPDDLVPAVLGAEYPMVVHCPELIERGKRFVPAWRSRWKRIEEGEAISLSGRNLTRSAAYGQLLENPEAVRVSVDLPAGARDEVVQLCMAMGVPVVVWDREHTPGSAGEHEHGKDIGGPSALDHLESVATGELPDGIRAYRAKQLGRPDDHPGQPVLGWSDAERPLPRLHLTEPEEAAK